MSNRRRPAWICSTAALLLAVASSCRNEPAGALIAEGRARPDRGRGASTSPGVPHQVSNRRQVPVVAKDASTPMNVSDATADVVPEDSSDHTPAADVNPLAGCQMCHVDVEDEFIGSVHYKEKVGCVKCHGKSDGHIADENNEVLPDRLFTRQNVDALCESCHECIRTEEAEPAAERKICTDCHGAHDLVLPGKQ